MKVKVDGFIYSCDRAERTKDAVILTNVDNEGNEQIASYSGCNIVERAEVVDGEWEYDALAEPSPADRIEAQVTYTAMMTDTLLEV